MLTKNVSIAYRGIDNRDINWDQGVSYYLASWSRRIDDLVRDTSARFVLFTASFNIKEKDRRFFRVLSGDLLVRKYGLKHSECDITLWNADVARFDEYKKANLVKKVE